MNPVPLPAALPQNWPRQVLGGAIGAVVSVAIVLTLGVVALSPLGSQAAEVGVAASFTCVVVSAAVYGLFSRCLAPAGGASSATALIVATLVSRILAEAPAGAAPATLAQVVVSLAATVTLMGLLQLMMAALGLGGLARAVPQPVLAGFMNGIALLIVLSQLPALLGLSQSQWQRQGWQALPDASLGALLLGLGTAALVWLLAWLVPRAPGALLAMLAGVAAYHGMQAGALGFTLNAALGPTLDNVHAITTLPGLLTLFNDSEPALATFSQHGSAIVLTAVVLAIIGTLESMLNLRATDQSHAARHDDRRALWAMGLGNLVGGPLGALPMVQVRARATAMLQAGGHGRAGALGAAAASALMITVGAGLIAELPQAVLAGVMLTIGVSLVDRWSGSLWRRLRQGPQRRMVRNSLAIMAFVCLLTVWRGPALGVAVGLVLSTVAFVRGMNRALVRSRLDGVAAPSRRVYPEAMQTRLLAARQRIQVLELEGALFFGTADRVADEVDRLDAQCRFLVLDLRRVSTIDDSAVMALGQLQVRLARQGTRLLLAGVGTASAQREQLQAFLGDDTAGEGTSWFFDADHAVEFAEMNLLAEELAQGEVRGGTVHDAIPLSHSSLLQGLSPGQQAVVTGLLQTRQMVAGQRLFSAGDPADGLYLLSQGSVSVRSPTGQRYASFSPATMLGELAMLDGHGRSADAVADSDCVVHLLTREALATLAETDPPLCTLLYRNIALHLAGRLRVASVAWSGAAA